jgi:hypothetical protein
MTQSHGSEDLSDSEAASLWHNINRIIELSSESAAAGSGVCHQIYQLARDSRDLLLFDQVSRETFRRLSDDNDKIMGLRFPESVKILARNNQKINAIKELRLLNGCGLVEAKNAVEHYVDGLGF